MRWIAGLLLAAADRLDHVFDTDAIVTSHELHFDSEAYLSDLKNRIYTHYY